MINSYYSEVSRLENEYRSLIVQARSIHASNNGYPSRSEAEKYKNAAEVCSKLANISIGAEREHWAEKQIDASHHLRDISTALSPAAAQPNSQAVSGAEAYGKPGSAKMTEPNGGAKKPGGSVSQETVAGWFKDSPKYGFDKVSGMEDVKKRLQDCVRDVASSSLNKYLEMDTTHSFFFYGLPGCGKTFIVKAFAHELMKQGYKYMSLTGADIHSSLVGESEKIVERAFKEAVDNAPCILFIDEVESVCRNRNMPNVPAHAMSTTVSFLTSYNEILESEKPVIFIGATNFPNQVDPAMLDRVETVMIPLPDAAARTHAFKAAFSKIVRNAPGLTYAYMGEKTVNYNYRDIGRLAAKLRKALKDRCLAAYGENFEMGVAAMQNGELMLTLEMFDKAFSENHPSKKEEALSGLQEWDASLNDMLDK